MATELEAFRRVVSEPLRLLDWWHPDRTFRLWRRSLRAALRVRSQHGGSLFRMTCSARRLQVRELFSVDEILKMGLLNLASGDDPCRSYQSRSSATRMEEFLNRDSDHGTVEDKVRFYHHAEEKNLPIPRFWGEFKSIGPSITTDISTVTGVRPVTRYLTENCPGDLVAKPARSGYGHGVLVLSREPDGNYSDPEGKRVSVEELIVMLQKDRDSDRWVLQERAVNHSRLVALSGSHYLQTVRFITMIDGAGQAHMIHAHCKLIVGHSHVDNFCHGATGNLIVGVNISSGCLREGWTMLRLEGGYQSVTHHPTTGRSIVGFQLPDWESAVQLAIRAATAFKPLRMVGWDIAMTPSGPILIEGNWNSDPPNPTGSCARLRARIEKLL